MLKRWCRGAEAYVHVQVYFQVQSYRGAKCKYGGAEVQRWCRGGGEGSDTWIMCYGHPKVCTVTLPKAVVP